MRRSFESEGRTESTIGVRFEHYRCATQMVDSEMGWHMDDIEEYNRENDRCVNLSQSYKSSDDAIVGKTLEGMIRSVLTRSRTRCM